MFFSIKYKNSFINLKADLGQVLQMAIMIVYRIKRIAQLYEVD
jgi:hypothetical protein